MAVRVKDVAQAAGVSTATVSRVLNDDPRIADGTRKKVLTAIEATGYRMNNVARSLKTRKTRTIGFLVPELANDFYMTIAQGVEDQLKESGYSVLVCNANESADQEKGRIDLLIEMCVDGVIIIPSTSDGTSFKRLTELNIPTVLVDRLAEPFAGDAVLADNVGGTYAAMEHLIDKGCRRFGFIGGDLSLTSFHERYDGFRLALKDYQIPLDEEIIRFGHYHVDTGYTLMGELMDLPDPPHHIFIANYFMHVGATKYLIEHRDRIPEPVSIAGFDDMALSSILGFSSLTISQPMNRMGREAAHLLLRRLGGDKEDFPQVRRLKTELIVH